MFGQERQRLPEIAGLVAVDVPDGESLPCDVAGVERHRGPGGEVPHDEVAAASSHESKSFGERCGNPGHLHTHVGSATVGELQDGSLPIFEFGQFVDVDDVVGAECAGLCETGSHPVDDQHARSSFLRDGDRIETQTPRALDENGLVLLQRDLVDPVEDLTQCAVGPRRDGVGDLVRNLVHVLQGVDVVVRRECGVEVGSFLRLASEELVRVVAEVVLTAHALGAPLAGLEIGADDAVADGQRDASVVGGSAITECQDAQNHLVAQSAPLLHGVLSVPDVQLRAAHVRAQDLHEDAVGLELGEGVFGISEYAGFAHIGQAAGDGCVCSRFHGLSPLIVMVTALR